MKKNILIAFSLMALWISPALAAEPSVEAIISKANLAAYYGGDDGRSDVSMTITDSQNRTRTREFVILRKNKEPGGQQFFYVYFRRPNDVRNMAFLVHKHVDKDDDRWLYLPALDLVRRIAASDKRTSFVGSNFMYEDVSGRNIHEDSHELIESTDTHYVIKSTPENLNEVEFSSYTVHINKESFLPVKAVYLDKNGKEYRLVEAVKTEVINGIPTVTESKVTDLSNGSFTVSQFSNVQYNIGLKEEIFTERYLRQPPREVRR